MKRLIFIAFIFCFCHYSNAQGIIVGPKGAITSSWLLNSNVFEDDDQVHTFTLGNMKGLTVGFQATETIGFMSEILLTSHNQKYHNGDPNSDFYLVEKLKYLDFALLARFSGKESVDYFAVGPQFSILTNATTYMYFSESNNSEDDAKEFYHGSNIFLVMAYGANFKIVDNLFYSMGFRFAYGFSDVTNKKYRDLNTGSGKYKPTYAASVGLELGLTYLIEN